MKESFNAWWQDASDACERIWSNKETETREETEKQKEFNKRFLDHILGAALAGLALVGALVVGGPLFIIGAIAGAFGYSCFSEDKGDK